MSRNEKLYEVMVILYSQLVAALLHPELKTIDQSNRPTQEDILNAYMPTITKIREKIKIN